MPQTESQSRASDAVASWLAKNHKNPAWLVTATKADPGTISDFLNGKRWPKLGTLGKIEDALGWPAGIIRQIGNGAEVPDSLVQDVGNVRGHDQDPAYVAAPGDTVNGGDTDDEVLASIRAMREDMRALRTAIERLADGQQPRT